MRTTAVIRTVDTVAYRALWFLFDQFTRDELRAIARRVEGISIGRNKKDTISNLVHHRGKFAKYRFYITFHPPIGKIHQIKDV